LTTETSSAPGLLQPRYRRVLSFGDVLDESVQLYRQQWTMFALVSAVGLLPPGLILLLATGSVFTALGTLDSPASLAANPGVLLSLGAAYGLSMLASIVFSLLWSAALIVTTMRFLHGETPRLGEVYGWALRRFLPVLGGTLVVAVALVLVSVAATVLFVITLAGLLGGLVAAIGLLFWWLQPSTRKPWLKWLIILTAPFGLVLYFAFLWSMYAAAQVLERQGPIGGLRRSQRLVDGHWFRVTATLIVGGLIVGVLQFAPAALVEVPLTVTRAAAGVDSFDTTGLVISSAVRVILQILFASIGMIIYTLVFVDLRNRREGTDIAARLDQLEATRVPADG
jgi:hypothetical protein